MMRSYSKGWLCYVYSKDFVHSCFNIYICNRASEQTISCAIYLHLKFKYTSKKLHLYVFLFIYRAQDFYAKNMFAMMAGKLCGLLAVLAVPSILKILMCTNASSTPFTAYKRYLETIFHTLSWYDCELKPGSR